METDLHDAGVIIILKIGDIDRSTLAIDLGLGVAMYVVLTIFRGLIMFGVIPMFRRSQYGYTWRDALVITWGGLRGAVGLALAVAVSTDMLIVDCKDVEGTPDAACIEGGRRIKDVCMLHTCLVVLLTLVINASTSGPMLRKLGLTALPPEKVSMVNVVSAQLIRLKIQEFKKLAKHDVLRDVIWPGVQRLVDFEGAIADVLNEPPPPFDPAKCWQPPESERKMLAPSNPESNREAAGSPSQAAKMRGRRASVHSFALKTRSHRASREEPTSTDITNLRRAKRHSREARQSREELSESTTRTKRISKERVSKEALSDDSTPRTKRTSKERVSKEALSDGSTPRTKRASKERNSKDAPSDGSGPLPSIPTVPRTLFSDAETGNGDAESKSSRSGSLKKRPTIVLDADAAAAQNVVDQIAAYTKRQQKLRHDMVSTHTTAAATFQA